ncbi:MAG TPA: immunoglobulin domain-containing protein, partial [Verrucomicrobiae bacterium]|nr:immunoglobulin domain-containing protein [Verrucomicrobiae bacterium]
ASIRVPPNRYRNFDNSLATNVSLSGHTALGDDVLPVGAPLVGGSAVAGLRVFNDPANFCLTCHSLPTGLGLDSTVSGATFKPIPVGTNGEHHFPLAFRLEGSLRSKIAAFRGLADKIGMNSVATQSQAGFGFGHDGSVDSLTRFLNGLRVNRDQDVADLIAFLLSVPGSDTGAAGAPIDLSPPAAVGRQVTLNNALRPALLDAMLDLARAPTSRVELIAKGTIDGQPRGWFYDRAQGSFQSDRQTERLSPAELWALPSPGQELTFTVVPRGSGRRTGIDRDLDGHLDRDEIDAGSDPADRPSWVRIRASPTEWAMETDGLLEAQIAPLPAPLIGITWHKDGQPLAEATNIAWRIDNVSFNATGDYNLVVTTPFQSITSPPVHIVVRPLLVTVTPEQQAVRIGSNALFRATSAGLGPFQYQWRRDGQSLPFAQSDSLTLSNVQWADEGFYQVVAANPFGAVTSAPVKLGLLVNPAVVIPPLSQNGVEGGNATFSFLISGHPAPFGFLLRKSSTILTNYTSDDRMGFLTLFNLQASNAGTYRIVITNAANPSPGLSLDPVTLTILADTDRDGLPDDWEAAHGLQLNDAADAPLDFDQDGLANEAEYLSGTDPRDRNSFLKVERIFRDGSGSAAVILFNAVSNKTYTIEDRDSLPVWMKATDVVAMPANRLVSVTNSSPGLGARFYRLVTPRGLPRLPEAFPQGSIR